MQNWEGQNEGLEASFPSTPPSFLQALCATMSKIGAREASILPVANVPRSQKFAWTRVLLLALSIGSFALVYDRWRSLLPLGDKLQILSDHAPPDHLANFRLCAINNLLETGLPFLDQVSPIDVLEFEHRRNRLAQALVAEDADAFVVEPGYTFKYYGNVSQPEWEVWEVSEPKCCRSPSMEAILTPGGSQRSVLF